MKEHHPRIITETGGSTEIALPSSSQKILKITGTRTEKKIESVTSALYKSVGPIILIDMQITHLTDHRKLKKQQLKKLRRRVTRVIKNVDGFPHRKNE